MHMACKFSDTFRKICDECWCPDNRKDRQPDLSIDECKTRCSSNVACMGIEFWSGLETISSSPATFCYECLDPGAISSFTSKSDPGFPPTVYERGIT